MAGNAHQPREPYAYVRFRTATASIVVMATVRAEEVRIPRRARDAVARHEEVVVVNRERPTFVIVHPDDHGTTTAGARRGRPLREALTLLAQAAPPDPEFADDMTDVLAAVGTGPDDPWAPS